MLITSGPTFRRMMSGLTMLIFDNVYTLLVTKMTKDRTKHDLQSKQASFSRFPKTFNADDITFKQRVCPYVSLDEGKLFSPGIIKLYEIKLK